MSQQYHPYRTNRDLFSNHYLTDHLRQTESWKNVNQDEVRGVYEDIKALWNEKKSRVEDYNEAQLERNFIRPIFKILGISYEIEETVLRNSRRPDYGFFPSAEAADAAFDRDDFYEEAVAVADAKRWGRKLDTRGEEKRDFENPSYQIHAYLQETPVQWAVLTNGEEWRLYYGPTSHRLDSYYEINLPEILRTVESQDGSIENFKDFYLFFRDKAFLPDQSGDCFLDEVYDESSIFAESIGEDLQDNIYQAIRVLAEGFLETNEELDTDDLTLIHDSSLIYLYRLIFVLYAESEGRDLLPTDKDIYRESYSLNHLKQTVVEKRNATTKHYQAWQTNLWDQLEDLFILIDQGSQGKNIPKEDLYIPAYNGGLFRTNPDSDDSEEAQFLATYNVGDTYLAEVIELLTHRRSDDGQGTVFVDYSSLDERHLGSIYEGILEYRIDVASENLTLEDGEYISAGENDEVVVKKDDVYLITGAGQRKATGSYYTPEYIVEYIVDETLGPLIERIRADLVSESADTTHQREKGFAEKFAERVFDLKILDPSMGSGHFLVNAVDYLAREIIEAQERQDQQAARKGNEDAMSSPLTEEGELRDINWARRTVAQRCIYGVDLNPLATELAKVSLWLRTLAAEQPLAFLDHHLKTGNSLIGSDIEEVLDTGENDMPEGQLTLQQSFDRTRQQALEHVMERFQELLSIENETLEDIKEMEAVYDEIREDPLYQHLIAMSNVHTAEAFNLNIPDDAYERIASALRGNSWANIELQNWFKSSQKLSIEKSFFHWELEFPVVFYDEHGSRKSDAGFDAVLGNPPWIRSISLKNSDETSWKYYKESYRSAQRGEFDIYLCFIEKGNEMLCSKGEFGYIVPNKWLTSQVGAELRELLATSKNLRKLVDFQSRQMFKGITTYSCLLFLQNEPNSTLKVEQLDPSIEIPNKIILSTPEIWKMGVVNTDTLSSDPWSFNIGPIGAIFDELSTNPSLSKVANVFKGIGTNADSVFLLNETEKGLYSDQLEQHVSIEDELLEPALKGSDIEAYHHTQKRFLLFPYETKPDGVEVLSKAKIKSNYPKAWQYLLKVRDELESRESGRYIGSKEWYQFGRPQNMKRARESKVVLPDVVNKATASQDFDGFAILDTVYGVQSTKYDLRFITALLNSDLLSAFLEFSGTNLRGGYFRMKTAYLNPFPVPDIEYFGVVDDVQPTIISKAKNIVNGNLKLTELEKLNILSQYQLLCVLVDFRSEFTNELSGINLNILDYLGQYEPGLSIDELPEYQPPRNIAKSILLETTGSRKSLRIGRVDFREEGTKISLRASARYKPTDEDIADTDRWGYTETELEPAITFVGLDEETRALIKEFVPVVVEKAGGFAGFRSNATKTNSIIDRLNEITLPSQSDIGNSLNQFLRKKEKSNKLNEEIGRIDEGIEQILYGFYKLSEGEIKSIQNSLE
ncbi:Eco57I restriction-modification methylase domain-containing protein [Haladaptatus sp. CMSO5]|uniref:Eco57I restriction-modification methylase domain-containing protein n=1 Tax=Haladaptatus sp. CMSO5 TaxID=3120514 RepID=UPI003FA60E09